MTSLSGTNLNNGAAVGPQDECRDSAGSFPKYPAYKASGVEWLGEVPQHWVITKFSRHFSVRMGETIPETELSEEGRLPVYSATERDKFYGYVDERKPLVGTGDLVIPARGNSIGFVKLVKASATATQTTIVANVLDRKLTESSYVYYWCLGLRRILFYFDRTAIPQITTEYVSRNPLLLPPLGEQTQIADFLDHETARIDALIEEQQRLIELLKEKRQAVISHAVTKGLDPTVPMKDSGVEWLGEVPAHWKVSKLGHYAQLLTGFPFPSASFSHNASDVRLLRGANIGVGSLKWIDTVYWNLNEDDELSSYLMTEGQIVLGMDRPWISEGMRIARVTQEDMPCLLLQRVAAVTPNAELNGEFLYCLLGSELFKTYVEPDLTGVSVPHISPEQILSFQIPVPHIDEQRKISRFIKDQLDQMSALFQHAMESIDLLQERRSALISAAVTGKIDVCDWQPPVDAQPHNETTTRTDLEAV